MNASDQLLTLKGKIAIVTGVGRRKGIGYSTCRELARNGADVFYSYWHPYDLEQFPRSDENPYEFANEFSITGNKVDHFEIDLSLPESPNKLIDSVVKQFGIPDILINNAAVSTHQSFERVSSELLDYHFAVNVRATTLLCQQFVKVRDANMGGHIINLTSGQSLGVMRDELPYTITKASVDMLTIQLAQELAVKGIRIHALDPGPTDTGWIDDVLKERILSVSKRGKINTPEDTAQLIISILTNNNFASGEVIHADR